MRCKWMVMLTLTAGAMARPDVVELQDGTRIEGRIVAETDQGVEIQVRSNEAGTIRYVMIIDASEIRTWMADAEGRVLRPESGGVDRLGGGEYLRRLLSEAQKKIDAREYDAGIRQFAEAAEIAGKNLDGLEPDERLEALQLRAHATRLHLAALEGKLNMLEENTEGVEDRIEKARRKLEDDWQDLRDDRQDYLDNGGSRRTELGTRRAQNEFEAREEGLRLRQIRFDEESRRALERLQFQKQEKVQTELQIELVEERVDQAEDELKRGERALRRR